MRITSKYPPKKICYDNLNKFNHHILMDTKSVYLHQFNCFKVSKYSFRFSFENQRGIMKNERFFQLFCFIAQFVIWAKGQKHQNYYKKKDKPRPRMKFNTQAGTVFQNVHTGCNKVSSFIFFELLLKVCLQWLQV